MKKISFFVLLTIILMDSNVAAVAHKKIYVSSVLFSCTALLIATRSDNPCCSPCKPIVPEPDLLCFAEITVPSLEKSNTFDEGHNGIKVTRKLQVERCPQLCGINDLKEFTRIVSKPDHWWETNLPTGKFYLPAKKIRARSKWKQNHR